jgi:hypothetical protein
MAKGNFTNLKGIKLYNALVKRLGEANKKAIGSQTLSVSERRNIVSKELYPKFKEGKISIREVNRDIKKIVTALPPQEVCNPLYLSTSYLTAIEYYEMDNQIRMQLPQCLDIRVNGGSYGSTKIFNTSNYNYYSDGVKKIIEKVRADVQNDSGTAYFTGIVKLKPRRKNDGNGDNYFVDYVLYINDEPEANDEEADFTLPKKENKKVEKVRDFLSVKFNELVKEKKKRQRQAKKKKAEAKSREPKEQKRLTNEAIQKAIASYRLLLKYGKITKEEFEKFKTDIQAKK